MKILLTGATGFIGSHTARELLRRGHEVHVTVRPTSSRFRIHDIEAHLRVHTGDMDSVPIAPDVAIHLAWFTAPGLYLHAAENRECLAASRRLLDQLSCRAVFVGTCLEYDTRPGRLQEDGPTDPQTLYAQCKNALRQDVVARGDSAWIRLFYQYGPWENPGRFVPSVIRAILRGEPAAVSPGGQKRDFLHVEDVAAAICEVATGTIQGIVNIGSGDSPSVRDIAMTIGELSGRPDLIRIGAIGYNPNEPVRIEADNRKLRSLGWCPKYTLMDGLRQTYHWWRNPPFRS